MNRWKMLLASCLMAMAVPASAEDLPLTISANVISSAPKVKVADAPQGRLWMIEWPRDEKERSLNLVVFKASPGHTAGNDLNPEVMHQISFKEGLGEDREEADVRIDDSGEMEIWDGMAVWLRGSELAERSPLDIDAFMASGQNSGKAPRGPERRYCLSFSWLAHDETRSMGGAYCKVMQGTEVPASGTMLTSLEITFN